MAVKPVPDGYLATPYLIVRGAERALDFYQKGFGARVAESHRDGKGAVVHAELRFGPAPVMLADEHPDYGYRGPEAYGGTPVSVFLYVEDVDALVHQAAAAGATVLRPLEDQFYGDRNATLRDPFGHVWTFATRKEDVSPEELQRRMAAMQA